MPLENHQQEDGKSEEAKNYISSGKINANDYSIVTKYLKKCGITSEISYDDIDPTSLSYLLERSKKNIPEDPCDCCTQVDESTKEKEPSHTDPTPFAEMSNSVDERNETNQTEPPLNTTKCDNILNNLMSMSNETKAASNYVKPDEETTQMKQDLQHLDLEPWQKALFEKLDNQHQTILDCQRRIQNLENSISNRDNFNANTTMNTELITIQRDVNIENILQESKQDKIPEIPQFGNEQPPQRQPNFFVLSILEAFINGVFLFPRKVYGYVISSRIFRILRLIQKEADNYQRPGGPNARFLDMALLAKVIFVCFVFSARLHGKGGAKKPNDGSWISTFTSFWATYRLQLFIFCAVMTYFIQTGLAQFIYHIFIKDNVIRRVWRDEDLPVDDEQSRENNDIARRRGRRDRALDLNNRNVNEHGLQGQVEGHAENPQRDQGQDHTDEVDQRDRNDLGNTFVAGAIEPRNINPNDRVEAPRSLLSLVKDFILDIMYFFGSFFLSLFPLWQPKQRNVVRVRGNGQENNIEDNERVED